MVGDNRKPEGHYTLATGKYKRNRQMYRFKKHYPCNREMIQKYVLPLMQ